MIGYLMQTSRGNFYIAGHGTIYSIAEPLSGRIQIVQSLTGKRARLINYCGGLTHHTIPDFPLCHSLSGFHNDSAKLMPQNNRVINRPTVLSCPLVKVTAAYPHISHFEKDIFRPRFGRSISLNSTAPFWGA